MEPGFPAEDSAATRTTRENAGDSFRKRVISRRSSSTGLNKHRTRLKYFIWRRKLRKNKPGCFATRADLNAGPRS